MTDATNKKVIDSAINIAIRYLSYQPRTVHEVEVHLKKKKIDGALIHEIIQILIDKKYLNDMDFANMFIQSQIKHKPKSRFAFSYVLKKKGVCPSIIAKALSSCNDGHLAKAAIEKKYHLWLSFDDEKFKKKIMNYLKYRGFSFDICLSTLEHFLSNRDGTQGD